MFEFFGWAVISGEEDEPEDAPVYTEFKAQAERLRNYFHLFQYAHRLAGLHFICEGLRNHRHETVLELYKWVAERAPRSYGLLYVLDDEDHRQPDYDNQFRVWKLVRGTLTEHDDPFLSPFIPTIEDPYVLPSQRH